MTPEINRIIESNPAAKEDFDKVVGGLAERRAKAEARWGARAAGAFDLSGYRIHELEKYLVNKYGEQKAA